MYEVEIHTNRVLQSDLSAEFDHYSQAIDYGLTELLKHYQREAPRTALEDLPDFMVKITDKDENLWVFSIRTEVLQGINNEDDMPECFGKGVFAFDLASCESCAFEAKCKAEAEAKAAANMELGPPMRKDEKPEVRLRKLPDCFGTFSKTYPSCENCPERESCVGFTAKRVAERPNCFGNFNPDASKCSPVDCTYTANCMAECGKDEADDLCDETDEFADRPPCYANRAEPRGDCIECAVKEQCEEDAEEEATPHTKPPLHSSGKLRKKLRRKHRPLPVITEKWMNKDVVVFDRYMFALPMRGKVIDVADKDGAVKVIFDKDNPGNGAGNISKHDGQYYHYEQCRVLEADTNMETEAEVLDSVLALLDEESVNFLKDNLQHISWAGLVGIYNLLYGNTYLVNGIKWSRMKKYGRQTKGWYVCSDEDMEQEIKDRLSECDRETFMQIYADIGCGQPEEHRVMWHHHDE